MMLRPCRAVYEDMVSLLHNNWMLRYSTLFAEQDFLDWYFRHERWLLPASYNALSVHLRAPDWTTVSGELPRIVHYTYNKFWFPDPKKDRSHKLICLDKLTGRNVTQSLQIARDNLQESLAHIMGRGLSGGTITGADMWSANVMAAKNLRGGSGMREQNQVMSMTVSVNSREGNVAYSSEANSGGKAPTSKGLQWSRKVAGGVQE